LGFITLATLSDGTGTPTTPAGIGGLTPALPVAVAVATLVSTGSGAGGSLRHPTARSTIPAPPHTALIRP
jgi:hypothetical protein